MHQYGYCIYAPVLHVSVFHEIPSDGVYIAISMLCKRIILVWHIKVLQPVFYWIGVVLFEQPMSTACLFLAAKVEEQPRRLEHVLKTAHSCLHRDKPPLDVTSNVSGVLFVESSVVYYPTNIETRTGRVLWWGGEKWVGSGVVCGLRYDAIEGYRENVLSRADCNLVQLVYTGIPGDGAGVGEQWTHSPAVAR